MCSSDLANFYGSRLAQLQENETTAIDNAAAQELAYQNQLISIYGTPFTNRTIVPACDSSSSSTALHVSHSQYSWLSFWLTP